MSSPLHVSPSPSLSMASRDPDGIGAGEMERSPYPEPSDFNAEAYLAAKAARGEWKLENLKNIDVAKLVGAPPPPPKAPPPKKNSLARRSTKAHEDLSSVEFAALSLSVSHVSSAESELEGANIEHSGEYVSAEQILMDLPIQSHPQVDLGDADSFDNCIPSPPREGQKSLDTITKLNLKPTLSHNDRPAMSSLENKPNSDNEKVEGKVDKMKEENQKRDKRRGFFKKLFRGKGKEKGSSPRTSSSHKKPEDISYSQHPKPLAQVTKKQGSPVEVPEEAVQTKPEQSQEAQGPEKGVVVQKERKIQESQPMFKSAPKSESERQYDDSLPGKGPLKFSRSIRRAFSQDPPDDEHGDPPIHSGPPLISPTNQQLEITISQEEEEQSRILSVRSRIAEIYEERLHQTENAGRESQAPISGLPSSLSSHRPSQFFNNDDVSALTGPYVSADPEPQGGHRIAQLSTKAQDDSPAVTPGSRMIDPYVPPPPTPAHLSHLHVQVDTQTVGDPTGESPPNESARDQEPLHVVPDPKGESPMAWKRPSSPNQPLRQSSSDESSYCASIDRYEVMNTESEDSDFVLGEQDKEDVLESSPMESSVLSTSVESKKPVLTKSEGTPSLLAVAKSSTTMTRVSRKSEESLTLLSAAKSSAIVTTKAVTKTVKTPQNQDAPKEKNRSTSVLDEMKTLEVENENNNMELSGFGSDTNLPDSTGKVLTVTAAAFTNAKAVAYLHRLDGAPSPRHTWHVSKKKPPKPESSAVVKSLSKSKKNLGEAEEPIDAEAWLSEPIDAEAWLLMKRSQSPRNQLPEKMFSAYNSKFQGRKPPSKKTAPKPEIVTRDEDVVTEGSAHIEEKPGKMTGLAVERGIQLRRSKRLDDIESGRTAPGLSPSKKPAGRNRFKNFFPVDDSGIKDPAQRAGRRLLSKSFSKSAIRIQASARRYMAKREALDRMWAIIQIQSQFRRWRCESNLKVLVHAAACKREKDMEHGAIQMQKIVRGYLAAVHVYDTMYFVIRIQAFLRGCYLRKMNKKMKEEKAAILLQSQWRKTHQEQIAMIFERRQKREAATAIQKAWRGFWAFSNYIIVQYEITRVQALVRGKLASQSYNLKLGCVIIIQAMARKYLAKKAVESKIISNAMVKSAAQELRERNASKRIQFWWRIVLDWMKEKKAALVIERFFIHVREEVDREIRRREKRNSLKKVRRRKKRRESEERLLERVQLKTVDEGNLLMDAESHRSKSTPRIRPSNSWIDRKGSSPGVDDRQMEIQRLDSSSRDTMPPTDLVRIAPSEDSEVSNITNPSVFHNFKVPSNSTRVKEKRMTTEDYIKKYGGGLQTAPNRLSSSPLQSSKYFFSEDGGTNQRKLRRVPSNGTPKTPRSELGTLSRRTSTGTPRSHSHSKTPRNSIGSSSELPSTPRSHGYPPSPSPKVHLGTRKASPRVPTYPSVNGRSEKQNVIIRRQTSETESETTTSNSSSSRSSPRPRTDGHRTRGVHSPKPVMVMKTYPKYTLDPSIEESPEVLYLGGEYGEV